MHRLISVPHRLRLTLLLASITAVLLAATAACGSGDQAPGQAGGGAASASTKVPSAQKAGPAPGSGSDPCRLLTREEAETSAAQSLGPAQRSTDVTGAACVYLNEDTQVSVTVSVLQGPLAQSTFDQVRQTVAKQSEPVPRIGDQAYLVTGLQELYVLQGNELLTIQLANPDLTDAVVLTQLTNLAQTALTRL